MQPFEEVYFDLAIFPHPLRLKGLFSGRKLNTDLQEFLPNSDAQNRSNKCFSICAAKHSYFSIFISCDLKYI